MNDEKLYGLYPFIHEEIIITCEYGDDADKEEDMVEELEF